VLPITVIFYVGSFAFPFDLNIASHPDRPAVSAMFSTGAIDLGGRKLSAVGDASYRPATEIMNRVARGARQLGAQIILI
jgi:hypothetical protein